MPKYRLKQSSFQVLFERIRALFSGIKKRLPTKRVMGYIDRRPFVSFFIALGILLLLIILGNVLNNLSKKEVKPQTAAKSISVYSIGSAPEVTLTGEVQKSGVYKIVAQTSGIVSSIDVAEGDTVTGGQSLITLSSNYQGGSVPALQAQLAEEQNKNITDTYSSQKAILEDQKAIATASAQNTTDLQNISNDNLKDTNALIGINQEILATLNQQLTTAVQNNDTVAINTVKPQVAQLSGVIDQLGASARSLNYQVNTVNPPTVLNATQQDMSLKQIDIQEKTLDLNKEVSGIQKSIAEISASLMNPASPADGTVDRIFVKEGDTVNPGTVLAVISGDKQESSVVLKVPQNIASRISQTETSKLHVGKKEIDMMPTYVSQDATDGSLYLVLYTIPGQYQKSVTDGDFINVDVPIGHADSLSIIPFVPLDAVYQTQNEAYVLVDEKNSVVSRLVNLGDVSGRFVAVTSGLKNHDQVILDRNVIAGDKVKVAY